MTAADQRRTRCRFKGRSWVRFRVRLGCRLRVLPASMCSARFGCSGAVFSGRGVCEKSLAASRWCVLCLAAGAGRCARAWWPCRRRLVLVEPRGVWALPAALLVNVTAGVSVVIADRVVACRRLLLSRARLGRRRLCRRSALRCGSAIRLLRSHRPPVVITWDGR